MIKIENYEVVGWGHAIRGMRNPLASWSKSDSYYIEETDEFYGGYHVGDNDLDLMKRLSQAGNDHAKYLRFLVVYADITAPDYWFKEFSTYRVGVTENSTSTMHRIHSEEFTLDDFSCEKLNPTSLETMKRVIWNLNVARNEYVNNGKKKEDWWQMIQLLPMSYNYRRTVCMNYQVLKNMYHSRKNHKLNEWHTFCDWIENLPYSEIITGIE